MSSNRRALRRHRRVRFGVVSTLAFLCGLGCLGAPAATGPSQALPADASTVHPNCPGSPCVVATETTGFQGAIAGRHKVSVAQHAGELVGWQLALAAPNKREIAYFDALVHGPPSAGIVVLRQQHHQQYSIVAASPLVALTPHLGRTIELPLRTPLPVQRGDYIGLTVPTWAPVLALGLDNETVWRASRARGQCALVTQQTALTKPGSSTVFGCIYRQSRLAYSGRLSPVHGAAVGRSQGRPRRA